MASPITVIKSRGIDTTGDYVVNSISSTGNVSAGNVKTDHLLYANGTPYVFTTNAAGSNTQVQFNDGNSFAGSANLTFDKTSGTLTANFFVGDGSGLTGLPARYTDSDANAAIDARVTNAFVDNLGVNASTLGGHSASYFATSTQGSKADTAVQPSDLANVAITGNYSDLNGKPTLFSGSYTDLTNKPTLFSGSYTDLTNKPLLSNVAITGNYSDLNGKPTLFDGEYASLANKPLLFSGSYTDLTNKPSLSTVATSGSYTDLTNKPTLFSGSYTDLTNKPSIPSKTSDLTNDSGFITTAALSGYATESYVGNAVANLVNSAPAALDTLKELADAIGDDANYATTVTNALANKLSTSAFTSTADTWLLTKSTSNVAEGTNLYYTVTRANTAIDARVTKSFVDNLNVNANTLNGHADTYFATSAGLTSTNSNVSNVVSDLSNLTTVVGTKLNSSVFNSTANTWLALQTTSNLTEGTNLYYTIGRANTAIDNRVTKSFVDNLGVVANIANVAYSVSGANVTGVVGNATHATVADSANSVAVANVVGIGNIATVNKDGNASNVLYGNGVFASAPVTYGNSNVASYLPTYTGNLSPGNLIISSDNLKVSGGTSGYVLTTDGVGNLSWTAQTGGSGSSNTVSTVTSVDTFTGDGSTTVFTLSVTPQTISQTFVNYNGALQLRNAYTLSGAVMTFSEAPANGSQIEVTTQMGVTSGSGNLVVRTYTADGVQANYSVSSGVNATNILVTENGLLQTPAVDYTVTGSTLTFTTAPGYGVKVQIRELGVAIATITPVGSNTQVLFNDAGSFGNSAGLTYNKTNSTLTVANVTVSSYVSGNLVPNANVTYDLGSSTNRWKDLYLSGNTIDLAGAKIKTDNSTGAIAFVPPPTVATPNPVALVITPTGGISTASTTNGVLSANAVSVAASVNTLASPRYITMYKSGDISASVGTSRYYPPSNVSISAVSASLSGSSSTDLSFAIYKNGSNTGAYTISANSFVSTKANANITLTTADYLTVNILSGTGTDLKLDLQYTPIM